MQKKTNSEQNSNSYNGSSSIFSFSENSQLSSEEELQLPLKSYNMQNSVSGLSLEELSKYLPAASLEVMIRFMKGNQYTPEQVKEYENRFMQEIKFQTNINSQQLVDKKNAFYNCKGKNDDSFFDFTNSKNQIAQNNNSHVTNNLSNNASKNVNNNNSYSCPYPYINVNLNINANGNNNNIILPELNNNNFPVDKQESKPHLFSNKDNDSLNPFESLQRNVSNELPPMSDYRNLDIFSLENNIFDMCDNPSFLYSDSNFHFLDNQVDDIIDSMFTQKNILITNNQSEDCNICFANEENNGAITLSLNTNSPAKSVEQDYKQNRSEIRESEATKAQLILDSSSNQKPNTTEIKNEENSQTMHIDDSKPLNNKQNMLFSLISQLEDLEKLVKNTKNDLVKYSNIKDLKQSDKDIFQQINIKSLNEKIGKFLQ